MIVSRWPDELLKWIQVATHVHSKFTDTYSCSGTQSLSDIANFAITAGLKGVVLNNHTTDPSNPVASMPRKLMSALSLKGLEADQLNTQLREQGLDFYFSAGVEANVMPSGSLDVQCAETEYISTYTIASQHGGLGAQEVDAVAIYRRLETVGDNLAVHTVGHPFRNIDHVQAVDWPRILAHLSKTNTAAEVNLNSFKKSQGSLDFWYQWLKAAANQGTPLVIGFDIHNGGMWPTLRPQEYWHTTLMDFQQLLDVMTWAGLKPQQVLNSDAKRFQNWILTPKPDRGSTIDW